MSQWSKNRERLLNEASGTLTSLDMLSRAHGGQWPPNGLDIVNAPVFEVHIRSMLTDPRVHWENAVETIQQQWGWATFLSIMTRAPKIGALVLGATFAWKYVTTVGYVRSSEPNVLRMNDFWMAAALLDEATETPANTKSHEMMHLIQHYDRNVSPSSAITNSRLGLSNLIPKGASDHLKYLMLEYEVQARLHTVISNSYIQHGRMPGSKFELWAHLISQGMTPPPAVLAMAKANAQLADVFARYPRVEQYVREHSDRAFVGQLEHMGKNLGDDDVRYKVWNSIYPILYGDMIELYGDRLGMVRMGHSHNVQLREIFMRAGFEYDIGKHDREITQTRMTSVANMMRPEDASSLLALIVSNHPYQEFHTKPVHILPGIGQLLAVNAFFNHAALDQRQVAATISRTTGMTAHDWAKLMLTVAKVAAGKRGKSKVSMPDLDIKHFAAFTPNR